MPQASICTITARRISESAFSCLEAITAVNRAIVLRLKRNLSLLAALSADYLEHLTLLAVTALTVAAALVAAVTATNRVILKTLFCVKFLLARTENEFLSTLLAS